MKWRIATPDSGRVSCLCKELGISRFLASLLVQRGVTDPTDAQQFLTPQLADFVNPLNLPGVEAAADRILHAIKRNERVVVFGDYDVDGISSVALVLTFLKDLGFSAQYMLPNRFVGGYGLGETSVKELVRRGTQLLITVDCGTSSHEEIAYLSGKRIDVVVTDHHKIDRGPPPSAVFVNPKGWPPRLGRYSGLAGVGVCFLVLVGVYIKAKRDPAFKRKLKRLRSYLDFVALGTIADQVPLSGVNRTLVVHGLRFMRDQPLRPGLMALRDVLPGTDRKIDEGRVAFYMAPRLNAAGRLGCAETSVEMLLCDDYYKAMILARKLEEENERRKELDKAVFEEADRMVKAQLRDRDSGVVVLASPSWHKGVLGIAAARIAEKYFRPTLLMTIEDGIASGSGRSVEGFDLTGALARWAGDLLLRYGGHEMAAGFSLEEQKVDELRERLEKAVAEQGDVASLARTLAVDCVVPLAEVNQDMILDVERLAPYGIGNPEPVIGVQGVRIISRQLTRGDHLKLVVEQMGRRLDAIGFRMGDLPCKPGDVVDLAFVPEYNTFQGQTFLQLRLKDVRLPGEEG